MNKSLILLPVVAMLTACGTTQNAALSGAEVANQSTNRSPNPAPVTRPSSQTAKQERVTSIRQHSSTPRATALGTVSATATTPLQWGRPPQHVRGLYVLPSSLSTRRLPRLLSFMRRHDLNSMVIDFKDDYGRVHDTTALHSTIQQLQKSHIYLIARIVTFKDPALARRHPEWAIAKHGGGQWTQAGVHWVDPYRKTVWRYNVSVAKRAVSMGFAEVQWDYVRFPDASRKSLNTAKFMNPSGMSKSDNIAAFLHYAKAEMPKVRMSADVFGLVTSTNDDMGIGQVWEKMSASIDVISPMMYPSHYGPGIYGLTHPERNPDRLIKTGLSHAVKRNARLRKKGLHQATIRPWLQDFTMRVPYGRDEVVKQIQAARANGVKDYLLWNQANRYSD